MPCLENMVVFATFPFLTSVALEALNSKSFVLTATWKWAVVQVWSVVYEGGLESGKLG